VWKLYLSLAFLGLAAIDPVGIGIMPVLLVQKKPYSRAFAFLGGSFAALMLMGLLFARGLGKIVCRFEQHNRWLVPTIELAAAGLLLIIATSLFVRLKLGKISVDPSAKTRQWLKLDSWHLFILGGLLVAGQSVLDIVFVIAMVRVGQFRLSNFGLVAAVATYAVTALILQLLVVAFFRATPASKKQKALERIHRLQLKYSTQVLIIISLALSCLLIVLAI
jgi:hypothetical protein